MGREFFLCRIRCLAASFAPKYVGDKEDIQELTDGILMIAKKSDGIVNVSWMMRWYG